MSESGRSTFLENSSVFSFGRAWGGFNDGEFGLSIQKLSNSRSLNISGSSDNSGSNNVDGIGISSVVTGHIRVQLTHSSV
jgi:hypothetical protein